MAMAGSTPMVDTTGPSRLAETLTRNVANEVTKSVLSSTDHPVGEFGTGLAFGILKDQMVQMVADRHPTWDRYQIENALNTATNMGRVLAGDPKALGDQVVDSSILVAQSFIETVGTAVTVLPPRESLPPAMLKDPDIAFMYALKDGANAATALRDWVVQTKGDGDAINKLMTKVKEVARNGAART